MSYNAGVHSQNGNEVVIAIYDIYADHGLTKNGKGRLVAFLQTNLRGVTIQLNADRPFSDMSHIPNSGYNADWKLQGNVLYITVHDLSYRKKRSKPGRTWLVAYRQMVVEDVHIKLNAYK